MSTVRRVAGMASGLILSRLVAATVRQLSHVYPIGSELDDRGRLRVGGCGVLELARECGTRQGIALAHRSLARLRSAQRAQSSDSELADGSAAELSFRESIRIFEECGSLHELARTQAELGFHLADRGEIDAAREALTQASITMKRLSLPELPKVAERLSAL